MTKRRPQVILPSMFDPDSTALVDPKRPRAKAPSPPRRGRLAPEDRAQTASKISAFPSWARLRDPFADSAAAAFAAGAGLALLDRSLRADPDGADSVFAGVLRLRLALKAGAACARLARLREDEAALRDAEQLSSWGAPTSPANRLHRLFRRLARPLRLDAATLSDAAELLQLSVEPATLSGLAPALRDIAAEASCPLTAAAAVSRAAMAALGPVAPLGAEIFGLWLADLALAQTLGWRAPVPLLATTITTPTLRRAGHRPRPNAPHWELAVAVATALAAHAMAVDLSHRAQRLLAVAPKLRAKSAGRVVALLLSDDAVSPARAAKSARLSDRAARRLFDRLIELGAVRELSGRPNFRLYGL